MGLIYNPSESRELVSNFQANISTCEQIIADLKNGNNHLIGVLNSKQLSGAAFNAGLAMFSQLVTPTVDKVDTSIQDIKAKLQQFSQYTAAAGGEILDEDKLNQQLEELRRQQATLSSQIHVYQNQARINDDPDMATMCYSYASTLSNFTTTIQDDIRKVEEKLKKLHELDMKTSSLFSEAQNEIQNLATAILAINSVSIDSSGNFSMKCSEKDLARINKFLSAKGSKSKSKTKKIVDKDKLTEQALEDFLKDGGQIMVYKDRARVKTANQNDLASDVSFEDADVVIWYLVKDGVVIKLSDHPELKSLSQYLQKKGGKLKKDQYTTVSFNQAEKMTVDSMDGFSGDVARVAYYFRPIEDAIAGVVGMSRTAKAVKATGQVPYGDMDKLIKTNKAPSKYLPPSQAREILDRYKLSIKDFNKLNSSPWKVSKNADLLRDIRESIPKPTETTVMRKVIPVENVEGMINNPQYANIGGFMTDREYVKSITDTSDIFNSSRLDYPDALFKEQGNIAYVDFSTKDIGKLQVPYNGSLGGDAKGAWPFSGSGFTSSQNGTIVPEWSLPKGISLKPAVGSTIHKVIDGRDTVVAEWVIKDNVGYWKDLRQ